MARSIIPIIMGLVLTITMSSTATAGQAKDNNHKKQWLFVQTAEKAELKALAHKQGHYTLTLQGINPQIVAFTDRPQRKTHLMKPKEFQALWQQGKDSFQADPPNAAIEFQQFQSKSAGIQTSVFELVKKPEYNADQQTMRYIVKPLHQKSVETGTYHDVGVFIDITGQPLQPPGPYIGE